MNTDLKPCPFCGEQPELVDEDDEIMREIHCSMCDFAITESANPEGAIARWNTRALASPQDVGERAALEGWVDHDGSDKCPVLPATAIRAIRWRQGGTHQFGIHYPALAVSEERGHWRDVAAYQLARPAAQPVDEDQNRAALLFARQAMATRAEEDDGRPSAEEWLAGLFDEQYEIQMRVEAYLTGASRPTKVREALEQIEKLAMELAGRYHDDLRCVAIATHARAALSTSLDPPEDTARVATVYDCEVAYEAGLEAGRIAGLEAAIEAAELLFCPMPETPQKRVSNGTIHDVQAAIRNLIQSSQGGAKHADDEVTTWVFNRKEPNNG